MCGQPCDYVKVFTGKGLHLNPKRRGYESEETFMRMWAFFIEHYPEQDKQPWLSRSRFPEILNLKDIKMENVEEGFDKT
jgi:hypothetical protein